MAYASKLGRAQISSRAPRAAAICDRCGFVYQHDYLRYQYDWTGSTLQNLRILVCPRRCYDEPQEQNRSIVIPADPVPIINPRTEPYAADEAVNPPPQQFSVTGYPNEILYLSQLGEIGEPADLPTSPPSGAGVYWANNAFFPGTGVLCVTAGGTNPLPFFLPVTSGTFWNNGGVVSVTPGGSFPLGNIRPFSSGFLWNNGGVVCIS